MVTVGRPLSYRAALAATMVWGVCCSRNGATAPSEPDAPAAPVADSAGGECESHVLDAPTRLRMCLLTVLLPEAPSAVACVRTKAARASCRVTGAAGDVRVVELVTEGGAFRVLSSERSDP